MLFARNIAYIIGLRGQLSSSEVKILPKMKVFLAIFAVALLPFIEPSEAVCMSTKGVPCFSKAEVNKIYFQTVT